MRFENTGLLMFYSPENSQKALTEAEHLRLVRWRLSTFWVMLVGYVGYYLCRGNLSAAFPLLAQEFGYSNLQLGMIASLSEIAYAAGKFINGPLADKIGGRRIFLIGMAGAIFWNVIFSMSASLAVFIVVWCCCRYFLSMGWGGLTKTIGNWYPPDRNGTVMGFVSVNFQFGGVLATLFAGFLVLQGVGWQGLFVFPALVLSVIWVWSYFASRSAPEDVIAGVIVGEIDPGKQQIADYGDDPKPEILTILKTLLGMNIYRYLLLFSFLTTLLRSVFFFWTPKFLYDMGLGASSAILKSAIFPLLGVLGTVLIGWYTDHYARNGDRARMMWMMLCCLVMCVAAIAFLSASVDPNLDLILIFLGASGFFLLAPYSMSAGCLTLDIAGAKGAGSGTGIIDGIGYIGGAMAAFSAGAMSDYLGWSQVFVVLSGFASISVLSAYALSRQFQKMAAPG
jgi:MFS transporter, OPA family, glycerol-3-phosphate transporter